MKSYLECWTEVAASLFSQALAGEPELVESLPKPLAAGAFGFAATIAGDEEGRFSVVLDPAILDSPLVGEGVDQKAGWGELLREAANAAAGELLAKAGRKCRVEKFEEITGESKVSRAFQLKAGERSFAILVRDEVRAPRPAAQPAARLDDAPAPAPPAGLSPALTCCWMSSWRFRCASAARSCRWAKFSISVLETWCRWIATWPTRWT